MAGKGGVSPSYGEWGCHCLRRRTGGEFLLLDQAGITTEFMVEGIRVVGGGAHNDLWNQIRADVSGLPVVTISQQEATVLGAALFALIGAGRFASVQQAVGSIAMGETIYEPSVAAEEYASLYQRYMEVPPALQCYYDGRDTNESPG